LCLGLVDSRRQAERRATTSLTFDAVRDALSTSRAKIKIVILDCCFSGLALTGGQRRVQHRWFEPTRTTTPHTYFTKYLAEVVETGIAGGPAVLTLDTVVQHLIEELASRGKPIPTHRS
jgi:hypothetical protein